MRYVPKSLEQNQIFNNIFRIQYCKPLIFQTQIIWFNKIYELKYLRSATFGSKDIVIIKSEFVAKTQFLFCSLKNWNYSETKFLFWPVKKLVWGYVSCNIMSQKNRFSFFDDSLKKIRHKNRPNLRTITVIIILYYTFYAWRRNMSEDYIHDYHANIDANYSRFCVFTLQIY